MSWQQIMRNRTLVGELLEQRHLLTALIDLDGDADVDIVDGGTWHENNDGFGNFTTHIITAEATLSTAGDLDGDGDLDVVAAGRATKNLKVYWNLRDENPAR